MRLARTVVWLLLPLVGGQPIGVPPTSAAPATVVAEGTITSVVPDSLVILTSGGSIHVKTTALTRVSHRILATLDDIKVGDYIGASTRKEADGTLTAVYINIFPSSLRNQIPEGQSPWLGGNVMTNAIVIEYVTAVSGRTLFVRFKETIARINVPPGAEITRYFRDHPSGPEGRAARPRGGNRRRRWDPDRPVDSDRPRPLNGS